MDYTSAVSYVRPDNDQSIILEDFNYPILKTRNEILTEKLMDLSNCFHFT